MCERCGKIHSQSPCSIVPTKFSLSIQNNKIVSPICDREMNWFHPNLFVSIIPIIPRKCWKFRLLRTYVCGGREDRTCSHLLNHIPEFKKSDLNPIGRCQKWCREFFSCGFFTTDSYGKYFKVTKCIYIASKKKYILVTLTRMHNSAVTSSQIQNPESKK